MEDNTTPTPTSAPPPASRRPQEKEADKATFKLKIPAQGHQHGHGHGHHRGTRYKEKFLALRERYEHVNAVHDERVEALDLAAAKIKRLQQENDLLLDAIYTASPTLIHLVTPPAPPSSAQDTPRQHHVHAYPPMDIELPQTFANHGNSHSHSHSHNSRGPRFTPQNGHEHRHGHGNGNGWANGNGTPGAGAGPSSNGHRIAEPSDRESFHGEHSP
ncbi:hypothetical protein Hypma_000263 [Hypsizygus marmoreus]|uniref:Uncharacterized protein n=1 Tax=Hypsizygus marmoreus TaxID=39966 RepID=A0A369JB57_HYPMA|nr:hypothetical protein Hypma_000263 [Hypsizygus marmoreus]